MVLARAAYAPTIQMASLPAVATACGGNIESMGEADSYLVDWTPVRAPLVPVAVGARMRRRLVELHDAHDIAARARR